MQRVLLFAKAEICGGWRNFKKKNTVEVKKIIIISLQNGTNTTLRRL